MAAVAEAVNFASAQYLSNRYAERFQPARLDGDDAAGL
jgi:hypothetical protein